MSPHEAFLKAIRMNPNDPLHERIYGDFLIDEGYDPPDEYLRQARRLAEQLHSAKQSFRASNYDQLGAFGLELLLSCRHLHAMRELYLPGRLMLERVTVRGTSGTAQCVIANIGERGVIRLVGSPLIEQITLLDIRFNNLGDEAIDALMTAPGLDNLEELRIEEPDRAFTPKQWGGLAERFGDGLKRPKDG